MTEVVVRIPEDVKLDAAELAKGIEEFIKLKRTRDLLAERLDDLLKESKLTEEDAIELGRMMKKGRFEKLKEAGLV